MFRRKFYFAKSSSFEQKKDLANKNKAQAHSLRFHEMWINMDVFRRVKDRGYERYPIICLWLPLGATVEVKLLKSANFPMPISRR